MTDAKAVLASLSPQARGELKAWFAESQRRRRLRDYRANPLRLAREVFPAHFSLPPAAWHEEVARWLCGVPRVGELESQTLPSLPVSPALPVPSSTPTRPMSPSASTSSSTGRRLALSAPRGHAKSKLASFLLPLYSLLMNRKHFIILISNTEGPAIDFVRPIRMEWEQNQTLRELVTNQVTGETILTPNRAKWTDSEFELFRNGKLCHKVLALSQGKQIRGRTFMEWRPDLIIIDDGETNDMVASDLQRLKYEDWIDTSVLHIDYDNDIIFVGNILHEQALMNRMVRKLEPEDQQKYGYIDAKLFVALDATEQSTWPEKESTETLLTVRDADPYAFAQEKQNQPVDPRYCPFKSEFFTERRWWSALPSHLSVSITIDPAWTIRDYSKETALVCAGWDWEGRLWVLDEHHGKYEDPSLVLDLILDWYLRWTKNEQANPGQKFYCVGFDTISAQKLLMDMFRARCRERQLHPMLRELKADRDKIRRIWQLEPLFRQERIFLRPDMVYLQHQLQGFPRNVQGGLVDVIDALAYHLQLAQFKPTEPPKEQPREQISFEEYAQMSESVAAYHQRFPDVDFTEAFGLVDGRLLSQFLR